MKLKKLLALLLAVSMLFVFAACEKDDDDDDDKDSKKEETETVDEEDEEDEEDEKTSKKDKDEEDEEDDEPYKKEKKESGKSVAPGQAAWSGYEDMPFVDFLEKGAAGLYAEINPDISVSIGFGWDVDELDEADVDEPYTISLDLEIEDTTAALVFYVAVEDGMIEVYGVREVTEFSDDYYGATDAEEFLESLIEYI